MTSPTWLVDLGRVEYGAAFALQRQLAAARDAGRIPDVLLLVEHPPVITLGRRGSRQHIYADERALARCGITVHETNRGGLVTYHGPGQIVGYPITRLRQIAGDAPTYVRKLEETIIRTLADFGIAAERDAQNRGVFTRRSKIAAIGVAVTHGVTMHGFALNVRPDLAHFELINPCGLEHRGVTSMERQLGLAVEPSDVVRSLTFHFARVFDRTLQGPPPEVWAALSRELPFGGGAACPRSLPDGPRQAPPRDAGVTLV